MVLLTKSMDKKEIVEEVKPIGGVRVNTEGKGYFHEFKKEVEEVKEVEVKKKKSKKRK